MKFSSMKLILASLFLFTVLTIGTTAQATITGDVTGGGTFSDNINSDNGWITESPAGNRVDFWTFTAQANDVLSVDITSQVDFGISVYFGEVMDDLGFAFNNNGNFTDPTTSNVGTYIDGTNGFFGTVGSSLSNITLANAGIYTIAAGGDLGFGASGPFSYSMDIGITNAVPEAATLPLIFGGMISLMMMRRKPS